MATDTERIAATLRVRSSWEAIDLGARLLRESWRPVFVAWIALVLPIVTALLVALRDQPWIALALVWYLKPLYDRAPLLVLGDALFGDTPRVRDILQRLPGAIRPGLGASLLWLRPSPVRALLLPVLQLEAQTGSARRNRLRLLLGRESLAAFGLTLVCLHLEMLVFLGLDEGVRLLVSEYHGSNLGSAALGDAEVPEVGTLTIALYVAAMTLVEPLYVAGGFGLYVNRRILLEGWDIELAFRRLARRALRAGGLATLLALVAFTPGTPLAEEGDVLPPPTCEIHEPHDAGPCVQRILETEEFATSIERSYWGLKGFEDSEEEEASRDDSLGFGLFAALADALAQGMRALAWVAVVLGLAALAVFLWRALNATPETASEDEAGVPIARTEPAARGALPEDVIGAARDAWSRGERATALSLLYRGALTHVSAELELLLPRSATEHECERAVRGRAPDDVSSDFAALVRAWQLCAYANEPPDPQTFESLCVRWQARLGAGMEAGR